MKPLYIFISALIIALISSVLFFADAIWLTQSNAHLREHKLNDLTNVASKTQTALRNMGQSDGLQQRRLHRDTFLRLSAAIADYNAFLDNPAWLKKQFLTTPETNRNLRMFQSRTLQMTQYISLMMQAETNRDLKNAQDKLAVLLEQNFFKSASLVLNEEKQQIEKLRTNIAMMGWMIIPVLAMIFLVIWRWMISPMVRHQIKTYRELKKSKTAALDMAERAINADAAKEQFLSVVSHELRTPLNGVIGLSDELQGQTQNKTCHSLAQEVSDRAGDLAVLVDELIALTENQTGEKLDIDAFMKRVAAKQKSQHIDNQTADKFTLPTGYSVLIADDNRTNRVVMDKLIKRMGITADIVTDGQQAVSAFEAGAYDLLLLDIAMPNKTGDQALREIRAMEKTQNRTPSKALAVTANTLGEQIDGYLKSGFDACLAKPINFARLSDKIETILA